MRNVVIYHSHRWRSQRHECTVKASATVCVRSLDDTGWSRAETRQLQCREMTCLVVVNGSRAALWDRLLPAAPHTVSVFQAAGRWWDAADACLWADLSLFCLWVVVFFLDFLSRRWKSLHWLRRCSALCCQKCEYVWKHSHSCYSSSVIRDPASPWAGCHSYANHWKNRAEWRNY